MICREICSEDRENVEIPKLPFIVVVNGVAYETDCVLGIMCIVVDNKYQDNEDINDGWLFRVQYGRKVAMEMLLRGLDVVVYDDDKGIIKNNYAANENDEDYEDESPENAYKLNITTEKQFLKCLADLGIITIMEREDSKVFRDINILEKCSFNNNEKCIAFGGICDCKDQICESHTKYDINEKIGLEYINILAEE